MTISIILLKTYDLPLNPYPYNGNQEICGRGARARIPRGVSFYRGLMNIFRTSSRRVRFTAYN